MKNVFIAFIVVCGFGTLQADEPVIAEAIVGVDFDFIQLADYDEELTMAEEKAISAAFSHSKRLVTSGSRKNP